MTIKHGTVVATYTEGGNFYCNVRVPRVAVTYNRCPVVSGGTGDLHAIKEDARVLIAKTTDETWVVIGALGSDGDALGTDLSDNERVLYADADTEIRLSKSNDSYQIDIDAGADININAAGSVYINGTEFGSHVHQFEDSDTGDTSDGTATTTTTTKETTGPQ